MSTNEDKYLVLRGKNKDIYFIQKRVSKKVSDIIGKEFIKKSLETSDIHIARAKRDEILNKLAALEAEKIDKKSENNLHQEKMKENIDNNDVNPANLSNNTHIQTEHEGIIDKYIDMEVIRAIKLPTKDDLVAIFDNNLGLIITIGVLVIFFSLN
ncbi:hypothetical protein N9I38_02440 [Gammaproteobacteria bacterium]|nr:hypothetical protein [Gammaproteobacteria bacterium]MDC1190710.1 hypothetical protein [Gammaproteobacteria bacterium]